MMDKKKKYLSDILIAIDLIEQFTEGITDFEVFNSDLKTQSAVERQLVIIGEALNQIRKIDSIPNVKHDKQIIGFRNRLVHAYDSIDNTIVWAILQRHLGKLKSEIREIDLN